MAGEAHLGLVPLHFDGEPGLMAGGAFVFFVGGMRRELVRDRDGLAWNYFLVQRPTVLVINHLGGGIRSHGSGRGNTIEEKGQPLMALLSAAADEHEQGAQKNQPASGPTGAMLRSGGSVGGVHSASHLANSPRWRYLL